jgi:endonuclease/exonuclease/phosphatase family metal-dependent hydrolase
MRIVTLNTWKNEGDYPRRLELIARGLQALSADVICLQECFSGGGWDTARFIADALGLRLLARPSRFKERPLVGRPCPSTSGLAILCRAMPLDEDAIALPDDPRDGRRDAQRLDLAVGDARLRVLNLHLTHLRDGAALRERQLETALAWADDGSADGVVVAGDLNARRDQAELSALGRAAPRRQGPTLRGRALEEPVQPIDHCVLLPTPAFQVRRSGVVLDWGGPGECAPSDHAGVLLEIERRAGRPADLRLRQDQDPQPA